MKYVPVSHVANKPAIVLIMAWRRTGEKPLSEPMMVLFDYAYASLGIDKLNVSGYFV